MDKYCWKNNIVRLTQIDLSKELYWYNYTHDYIEALSHVHGHDLLTWPNAVSIFISRWPRKLNALKRSLFIALLNIDIIRYNKQLHMKTVVRDKSKWIYILYL